MALPPVCDRPLGNPDETLLQMPPGREDEISPEMMSELIKLFGAEGEFETRRVN